MVAHESSEDFQEHRYRRRLVGAAVLIAMAVIFLPLIFDGSGTESQFTRISPLEDPPEFDAEILPEGELSAQFGNAEIAFTDSGETLPLETPGVASVPEEASAAEDISRMPQANAEQTRQPQPAAVEPEVSASESAGSSATIESEQAPAPARNSPKAPAKDDSSWLIQVASFGDKINDLSLRSDLKQQGFEVDVRAGESGGQPVFRVSVGPVTGEDAARSTKLEVEQTLKRGTLLLPLKD